MLFLAGRDWNNEGIEFPIDVMMEISDTIYSIFEDQHDKTPFTFDAGNVSKHTVEILRRFIDIDIPKCDIKKPMDSCDLSIYYSDTIMEFLSYHSRSLPDLIRLMDRLIMYDHLQCVGAFIARDAYMLDQNDFRQKYSSTI